MTSATTLRTVPLPIQSKTIVIAAGPRKRNSGWKRFWTVRNFWKPLENSGRCLEFLQAEFEPNSTTTSRKDYSRNPSELSKWNCAVKFTKRASADVQSSRRRRAQGVHPRFDRSFEPQEGPAGIYCPNILSSLALVIAHLFTMFAVIGTSRSKCIQLRKLQVHATEHVSFARIKRSSHKVISQRSTSLFACESD